MNKKMNTTNNMTKYNLEDFEPDALENLKSVSFIAPGDANIQQMHTEYSLSILIPLLQNAEISNKNIEKIIKEINYGNNNNATEEIRLFIENYKPKTFNNLIWLYKLATTEFFTISHPTDSNILHSLTEAFKRKVDFGRNPLHLHLITRELFKLDCLKSSDKNKIYFAKIISTISQLSLYLSICTAWGLFFQLLKKEQKMFRFHKFSEIVKEVKDLDVAKFKDKEPELYLILECISFLLNVITSNNIKEKIDQLYWEYFKYSNEDIKDLYSWCVKSNRNFSVKISENNFNSCTSLVSDMLELDLMVILDSILIANTNEDF